MKVRFTARALNDLDEIYDFISNDSHVYAKKMIDDLMAFSRGIAKFPETGRLTVCPDGTLVRERFHGHYHVLGNALEIITIRHTSRNPENLPL